MRVEIGGAQVTDAVAEALETLQTQKGYSGAYVDTLDDITRMMILDIHSDEDKDADMMAMIRVLQMIRKDLITLSAPPDVDDPANDKPAFSI